MSENYIVSARKYRPQTFDTVVGQEHITTTLKNAIRNQQLAHAFLFCGPRGVGKTTCARILARTINCEQPTSDTEACGTCRTCKSFQDNTSFNIFELDAASNNSVDDIRNLTDQVRFAPQQGKYKIYIIDEVHMLSSQAFNAFLKTLEEPPAYAIFILATTEKHRILPTILSRCQIFDFKRITTADTVAHLQAIVTKEGKSAEEAALHVIAQKSEGCMRDALSMLDRISGFTNGVLTYANTMEHLNMLDSEFYFGLTDQILAQDVSSVLLTLDGVLDRGFEGDVVLEGLAEHMRNLLLCKDARMAKLLDVPQSHQHLFYEKARQAPPSFILSALNILQEAGLSYKSATNKRLHAEMCLIRLCYLMQAIKPNAEGSVEKKNPDSVVKPTTSPTSVVPPPAPPQAALSQPAPPKNVSAQPAPQSPATPITEPRTAPQKLVAPTPIMPVKAPADTPSNGRRISRNLLADLDNLSVSAGEMQQLEELNAERVKTLFEEFRQQAKEAGRSVLYAQLSMMAVEWIEPDEVRIISPSEITNEYALDNRSTLIEHFSKHAGRVIRVTTEVRIDTSSQPVKSKVLSKSELYEVLATKNPNLAYLKEQLNLQIEY